MIAASSNNVGSIFPSPFELTGECKLFNYCTSELGHFLNGTANALVGNPLRIISLDGLSTPQKEISTSSATLVELNCSGRYLSLANGGDLSVYDLQKGSTLRELHDHDGKIGGVAWHRESPWLLASVGDDCTLRLWDLRSHPAQIAIRRSTKPYRRLEFSPDCNYIACAGELVSIFELCMAQNVVHMLSSSPSSAVRFNPSECLLATADDDRTVRFWDVDTGECVTQSPTFNAQIGQIHFEPNGKYLIVVTEKQTASLRWEPFELFSQLNHKQQLHFPLSTSNSHTNGEQQRLLLLDVNVRDGWLHQLVVQQNADPAKSAIVCSASLSLAQIETCGIAAAEGRDMPVQMAPRFFGNEIDLIVKKKEGDLTPEAVSSTPDSLLNSLIIDQDYNDDGITQANQTIHVAHTLTKPSFSMPNNRRNVSVSQKNVDPSSVPHATVNRLAHQQKLDSTVANTAQGFRDSTPQLQRPSRLSIVSNNPIPGKHNAAVCNLDNNSIQKPSSLIRRGSSLNDVANCASTSIPNCTASTSTHHQSPSALQPNSFGVAKNRVHHSNFSSSTMSSSSSNASSNASSSLVGSVDGQATNKRRSESEVRTLEEFMQVNTKLRSSAHKFKIEAGTLLSGLDSIQLNKAEHIINVVAYFDDVHIFAKLLHDYLRQQRDHSLALCAAFLPRVELLIKHRNREYPQIALDFLQMVLTSYGDAIRHGLSSRDFTIGVDVAAEQRFDRCNKCKNALLQIRMNSSYCIERLDSDQRQRFDNLMTLVDNYFSNSL